MRVSKVLIASVLTGILAAWSCQPNIFPEPERQTSFKPVLAEGGEQVIYFSTDNRWSIYNPCDWVSVNPLGGLAGENQITVTFKENKTLELREGAIYILDGARTLMLNFEQESLNLIATDHKEYFVPEEGGFTILAKSSIDFDISSDSDWIVCPSDTHFEGSVSEFTIDFSLKTNTDPKDRRGKIEFRAQGGLTYSVDVIQSGKIVIDWTRDFYKAVLGYRFTGDWCGYCPNLAYDISAYAKEQPGRFNCLCFYDANSNGYLKFAGANKYETKFGVAGKPTIVIDERGSATNMSSPDYLKVIRSMCEEDRESYKAATAITASVSISDGQIGIHPVVYSREEGDFHIHVAILENGLVVAQHDYTGLYTSTQLEKFVHDAVVRSYVTPMLSGESFHIRAKDKKMFNYSVDIPSGVRNTNNIAVAIYVTRPVVEGPQSVAKVTYYKHFNEFVDNSVIVPLGQSVSLKYEN